MVYMVKRRVSLGGIQEIEKVTEVWGTNGQGLERVLRAIPRLSGSYFTNLGLRAEIFWVPSP